MGIAPERLAAGDFDGYDEVFLLLDDTDDYLGDVEVRPAARCLTVSFRGTHGQAAPRYERLLDYMHERDLIPRRVPRAKSPSSTTSSATTRERM